MSSVGYVSKTAEQLAMDLLEEAKEDLFKNSHRPAPGYLPWKSEDDRKDPISVQVVKRYARLQVLRTLYLSDATKDLSPTSHERRETEARAYRLAVADLFVETALDLLERKSIHYKLGGIAAYIFSGFAIVFGVYASFEHAQPFAEKQTAASLVEAIRNPANFLTPSPKVAPQPQSSPATPLASSSPPSDSIVRHTLWFNMASSFARSFTFYGFIVLAAVTLWRFGRAMLDQSERLHDRRHALRQGRLFVHLRDGQLSAEELAHAFAWNIQQPNAFANMPTEAKAPWGGAFADLSRFLSETSKDGSENPRRGTR